MVEEIFKWMVMGIKEFMSGYLYLRQLECRKWGNFWQPAPLSPHSGKTRRRPVSSASSTMSPDDVGECVQGEEDQELMANGSEEESIQIVAGHDLALTFCRS